MLICSLSGEVATEPVLSPKSGKVFEKKLIVNYLSTNDKDPINDQPLSIEELIPIDTENNIVTPKPPTTQSIPTLLSTFQNEFDAMALEIFTLRKQLHKARQELSSALYHYDAAVKVAASAIKERDDVKQTLQELSASIGNDVMGTETNGQHDEPEAVNIDDDEAQQVINETKQLIDETRTKLFQLHKSQKISLPVTQPLNFTMLQSQDIKDIKLVYYDELVKKLILGSGKQLIVKDLFTNDEYTINHKGGLISINFIEYNSSLVPIYATKTMVKFDDQSIKFKSNIIDIKSHPKLKNIFIVLCNKSFTLCKDNATIFDIPVDYKPLTCEFHVDGAFLAIGTDDGQLLVYELTKPEVAPVATITTKYPTITKIVFGLNGYWVLVSSTNGSNSSIEFIDLRKSTIIHTIDFEALNDFTIDKSCSMIVSCSNSHINLHRYIKKGKIFENFIETIDSNDVQHLYINDFTDDSIKGFSLSPKKLTNYEINFT